MSGRAILVVLALAVVVGGGLGGGLVYVMARGRSAGLARPVRATGREKARTPAKAPPGKDLREFMKLVSRTSWYRSAEGRDFRGRAGAWQDAIAGRRGDVAPLVGRASVREATLACLLWEEGSRRARRGRPAAGRGQEGDLIGDGAVDLPGAHRLRAPPRRRAAPDISELPSPPVPQKGRGRQALAPGELQAVAGGRQPQVVTRRPALDIRVLREYHGPQPRVWPGPAPSASPRRSR